MRQRTRLRFVLEGLEGLLVFGAAFCTWPVSRYWLRNLGADRSELDRSWPGDELVAARHETSTRAIGIAAPATRVWAWIVQFGLGRAGFYSYELLERLVGVAVTNIESIEPDLQELAVGDAIRLHSKAPGIVIAELVRNRSICFGSHDPAARPVPARSWSIYIEPAGNDACRLLVRSCIEPAQAWRARCALALEAPVDFVMEQRMLRTVKRLAES